MSKTKASLTPSSAPSKKDYGPSLARDMLALVVSHRTGAVSKREAEEQIAENRRLWTQDPVRYFRETRDLYWMEKFHERWLEHQCFNERTIILAPRDHRKTALLSIEWFVWRILTWKDWNIRANLIMHSATRAFEVLMSVRGIFAQGFFQTAPELEAVYGSFVGVPWTQSRFTVAQGTQRDLREPTLAAFGFGGAVTSGHYDVTVIDDPIDAPDTATPHLRNKSIDHFKRNIVATPGKELHIVGHPWWPADLYHYFLEEHLAPGYKVVGNKVVREER